MQIKGLAAWKRMGYLEIALGIAALVLLAQLFPETLQSIFSELWRALDVRNWSTGNRILANLLLVLLLIFCRYLPEMIVVWKSHSIAKRRTIKRRKCAPLSEDEEHKQRLQRDAEWVARAKNRRPFT